MPLKEVIGNIRSNCQYNRISIGHLIDSAEERIFGILLLFASLAIILPISMVPGISPLCALTILISAYHIFFERRRLWLPDRIRNMTVCGKKTARILIKMQRFAQTADKFCRPRLEFMTEGLGRKLISGTGMILAIITLFFGFIPLMCIPLMTPIVFFGLGICMKDGLMTGIGWILLSASTGSLFYLV
jgi:hypothetical protein